MDNPTERMVDALENIAAELERLRILRERLDAELPEPLEDVEEREGEQRVQVREALDKLLSGDEDDEPDEDDE